MGAELLLQQKQVSLCLGTTASQSQVQQPGRGASREEQGWARRPSPLHPASLLTSRKPFLVTAPAPVTPGRPSQYRAWRPWSPLATSRGDGAPVPRGPKVSIIAT